VTRWRRRLLAAAAGYAAAMAAAFLDPDFSSRVIAGVPAFGWSWILFATAGLCVTGMAAVRWTARSGLTVLFLLHLVWTADQLASLLTGEAMTAVGLALTGGLSMLWGMMLSGWWRP